MRKSTRLQQYTHSRIYALPQNWREGKDAKRSQWAAERRWWRARRPFRRRIENNEVTLDTIADSLLRIFVRMEKLDASLGHLSRRITDLENLSRAPDKHCRSHSR